MDILPNYPAPTRRRAGKRPRPTPPPLQQPGPHFLLRRRFTAQEIAVPQDRHVDPQGAWRAKWPDPQEIASSHQMSSRTSADPQIVGRRFAIPTRDQFVTDLGSFNEPGIARLFDRRDVDEHIGPAALRLDKSVSLGRVEPLNRTQSHLRTLQLNRSTNHKSRLKRPRSLRAEKARPCIPRLRPIGVWNEHRPHGKAYLIPDGLLPLFP